MLYDVTNKDVRVKPIDAESYELLIKAKTSLGTVRFRKDCSIIDVELARVIAEGEAKNKLVFTKAGFITGHQAIGPKKDIQHIWDSAEIAYPSKLTLNRIDALAGEMQLKFIGGLVRWRISLLNDDTWLVYRQPSGKYNQFTGKEITISMYWIDNSYVPPAKTRGFTMSDLSNKMSSARL
jgi:hypothetical protein